MGKLCHFSGCAWETQPGALPSSCLLGGAQGSEPQLPEADSDVWCPTVSGPALTLCVSKALPWVLGFPFCPQWMGTQSCCEFTRWFWEGLKGPRQRVRFPFKESFSSFLVGIDLFQELSKSEHALSDWPVISPSFLGS